MWGWGCRQAGRQAQLARRVGGGGGGASRQAGPTSVEGWGCRQGVGLEGEGLRVQAGRRVEGAGRVKG